jgi:methyl-accepting chemotaxis protein
MQFSLKNTSIRIQILLPVLLTALALFVALGFTASTLEKEQNIIASNTDSFVFYKDQLAKVDDIVYPLRIGAVYAIYDTERRANFTNELRTKVNKINSLLDEMETRKEQEGQTHRTNDQKCNKKLQRNFFSV